MDKKQPSLPGKNPLVVEKIKIDDPDYMSEVPERLRNQSFPGFPSCSVFVGMPGSGKTNTLIFMLRSSYMWNRFFDKIYLLGPTVKSDKMYETITVPEDQIIADQKDFLPKLEEILDEQQQLVEADKKEAPKVLFVFEDITSYYNKIQNTPGFARCYTQIRHLKGSSVAMVHKYKAFNRTARMSSQHILVWRCNKTEIKQLYEDYGPSSLNLKQWFALVDYCHTSSAETEKPFLYINMHVPEQIRFRKCFSEILKLKDPLSPAISMTTRERDATSKRSEETPAGGKDVRRKRKLSASSDLENSLSHNP